MKKSIRLGAVLILLGICIFFVGFAVSGFDISRMQTHVYEQKTFNSTEDITEINLNSSNRTIYVDSTNSDVFSVTYFSMDKNGESQDINVTDGVLNITEYNKPYKNEFSINFQSVYTKISIPADKKVKLNIDSDNHYISIYDLDFESITINTSNTSVHLSDINVDDFIKCTSSNTSISLDDTKAKSIDISSTNNRITLNRLKVTEKLSVLNTNSSIYAEYINAPDISLSTTNSSITGILHGTKDDYNIESSTTNGYNTLPEKSTPENSTKKLYVKTTNGNIKFTFYN